MSGVPIITDTLALAASQAKDNPVFVTQYAHARICRIQAKVAEAGIERLPLADVDLSLLTHEAEHEILRTLFGGPTLVELAARERAPHRVVGWLRELASGVHSFYQHPDGLYVIGNDVPEELTQARLWLIEAARIGLAATLGRLGVSAPQSMWTDDAHDDDSETDLS